jgi:hypothetical protein
MPTPTSSLKGHPYATTPPGSSNILPLTPPASDERCLSLDAVVNEVLEVLENCRGQPDLHIAPISLQRQQYRQLLRELNHRSGLRGYVQDKLLLDYDPNSEVLDVRMPAPVHDFFSTSIAREIDKQLQLLGEQSDAIGAFAIQIANGGSSRILLKENFTDEEAAHTQGIPLQRHPDAQFQHWKAVYPGVVLEISYSQDGKDLDKLAWQYIQHSNGDIKAVVGIDVNYGEKESTVSLWQPHYYREGDDELDTLEAQRVIKGEPFRLPNGEPINQERELRLTLSDFATDKLCDILDSPTLVITYGKLAQLLDRAEQMQQVRESAGGTKSGRKTKKRQRSSSPAEQIRSDDEARFLEDERRAIKKVAAEDEDFEL